MNMPEVLKCLDDLNKFHTDQEAQLTAKGAREAYDVIRYLLSELCDLEKRYIK